MTTLSADELATLLRGRLELTRVEVIDFSHKHAKHREARQHGGSHFEVLIESPVFAGLSRLDRSRRVHDLLAPELARGLIHALTLTLRAPGEGA
jgi:BolA protein